jgi:hypothetical protein
MNRVAKIALSSKEARLGKNSVKPFGCRVYASNENKMSDGGRERASLGVGVLKSSQKWSAQRSAVRSIAWLDLLM